MAFAKTIRDSETRTGRLFLAAAFGLWLVPLLPSYFALAFHMDDGTSLWYAALPLHDKLFGWWVMGHPPLYFIWLSGVTQVVSSEAGLRLLNAVLLLVAAGLAFSWLRRLVGTLAAVAGASLVFLSPPLMQLTLELRQYSLLLAMYFAALYCGERWINERRSALLSVTVAIWFLAVFTIYSAMAFVLGHALYLTIEARRLGFSRRAQSGLVAGYALVAAALLTTYFVLLRHQREQLVNGWRYLVEDLLPLGADLGTFLSFLFERTRALVAFYVGGVEPVVGGILVLAGLTLSLTALWLPELRERRRAVLFFLATPFLVGMTCATLRLFPYGALRNCLFVFPALTFCVAALTQSAIALAPKLARKSRLWSIGGLGAIALFGVSQVQKHAFVSGFIRSAPTIEGVKAACAELRKRNENVDLLLTDHPTAHLLTFYLPVEAVARGDWPLSEAHLSSALGKPVRYTKEWVLTPEARAPLYDRATRELTLPGKRVLLFSFDETSLGSLGSIATDAALKIADSPGTVPLLSRRPAFFEVRD